MWVSLGMVMFRGLMGVEPRLWSLKWADSITVFIVGEDYELVLLYPAGNPPSGTATLSRN